MPVINVEGLGQVEIAGTEPTEQEAEAIKKALGARQANPPRGAITDAVMQTVGGIRDAAQNVINNAVTKPTATFVEQFPNPVNGNEPFRPFVLPAVPEAETKTGAVVRSVSQFLGPYLGAMKMVGLGQSAFSSFMRLEGTAILTEQAVFDPFEQRLSDMVEQFPVLSNPVTSFLQSNPDDSEMEARLKLALESVGLTAVMTPFVGALKGLRALKRGDTKQALEEIEQAAKELPTIVDPPKPQAFLGQDAQIRDFAMNVNLRNIDDTDEVKNVLQVTADTFTGRIDEARRGIIRDEQMKQLAVEANVSVDDLLSRNTGDAWSAERILAARQMMATSADNLLTSAKRAAETGLDADLLAYRDALSIHLGIQEQVSGLAAEAGRALRQFRFAAGANVEELLNIGGGAKTLREQATLISQIDNVEGLTRMARAVDEPTLTDKALEVWINGLLSGPQTHAVNALSNTLTGLWSLPEHWLAAGIGAVRRTDDRETFTEVMSRTVGWFQGARDGFALASKTFLTEQPSDVFSKLDLPRQQAVGGVVGQFVRLPGRALMASDEFFKSIGYRMELNSRATKSALDAGLDPRSREFAEHVQGIINSPPKAIELASIDNARYLTFTKPLEGVSRHILAAERELPFLRIVMPFVRTPTNIVRFAGERTPFGLIMRETRDATGAQADLQAAKMAIGSMAGVSVASMAVEGHITGSGPSDPVARDILRETGWQPYSVAIPQDDGTKRYVQYSRIEPLGIIFGLAADFSQIAGEMTDDERDSIAAMITGAVSQNLTDKTFFKGLSDLIGAVNDPDQFMDAYVRNLAGTVVPTGAAQVTRTIDPVLRDTRTAIDRIKSRIPGYSDEVPARLNIWGEPIVLSGGLGPDIISPLYSSTTKFDAATNELVRLELFPRLPQRVMDGEDIPQDEYWTFVRNSGRLAHDQIVQLVSTPQWRTLDNLPETQRSIIRSIISENRNVARAILRQRLGRPLNRQQMEILEQFGVELPQAANQ